MRRDPRGPHAWMRRPWSTERRRKLRECSHGPTAYREFGRRTGLLGAGYVQDDQRCNRTECVEHLPGSAIACFEVASVADLPAGAAVKRRFVQDHVGCATTAHALAGMEDGRCVRACVGSRSRPGRTEPYE